MQLLYLSISRYHYAPLSPFFNNGETVRHKTPTIIANNNDKRFLTTHGGRIVEAGRVELPSCLASIITSTCLFPQREVVPAGLQPATYALEERCSSPLSYWSNPLLYFSEFLLVYEYGIYGCNHFTNPIFTTLSISIVVCYTNRPILNE